MPNVTLLEFLAPNDNFNQTNCERMMERIKSGLFMAIMTTWLLVAYEARSGDVHAIFKSEDRGRSWTRSDHRLPGDARVNAFGVIGEVLVAGTDSGIFLSRDKGKSWRVSSSSLAISRRVISLATVGPNIYGGTAGAGIIRSPDEGETWTRLASFPFDKARCLFGHDGGLYAGTEADGVWRSINGGQHWTSLREGLPDRAQIFAMTSVQGELFAGLYGRGLYRWHPENERWRQVGSVAPLVLASIRNILVAGHNPGGIQWSDDLGITWYLGMADPNCGIGDPTFSQATHLSPDTPVWEMAASDNIVLAGAADGVFYSKDRGRTWTRASTGLPSKSPGVSFLVHDDFILAGIAMMDPDNVSVPITNPQSKVQNP